MQLAMEYPTATAAQPETSRLSELIFPTRSAELVLSVVGQLSRSAEQRWLTWIGRFPTSNNTEIAARRLRRLDTQDQAHSLAWTLEALRNGTSHTVMTVINQPLDESDIRRLECAAADGSSQCILVRLKV